MSPIAEGGALLAVVVSAITIVQRVSEWLSTRRNRENERWYLGWTRPGEFGDEHFRAMLDRHLKGRKR